MKTHLPLPVLLGASCIALSALASAPARAESTMSDDRWDFSARLYGWFPSISGDLKYSLPGAGNSASVDAGDILNALEGVFMGSFRAQRGDWSLLTDLIYLNLANDKNNAISVPGGFGPGVTVNTDLELTGWVWNLAGGFRLYERQDTRVNALLGLRMLDMDTKTRLTVSGPLPPTLPSVQLRKAVTLWDGIVGLNGRVALNQGWFAPFYLDVGTGESSLTWQAMGGVGYGFNWGDLTLTYRHLSYDQGSDKLIQNLSFSGPEFGLALHF
jgi:hypothetical protein